MIYQIDDKYYINVAPNVYKEIELRLENDDLILVPTNITREVYKMYEVKQIYFQSEKETLKEKMKKSLLSEDKPISRKSNINKRR
jgi:hypothetical protein